MCTLFLFTRRKILIEVITEIAFSGDHLLTWHILECKFHKVSFITTRPLNNISCIVSTNEYTLNEQMNPKC